MANRKRKQVKSLPRFSVRTCQQVLSLLWRSHVGRKLVRIGRVNACRVLNRCTDRLSSSVDSDSTLLTKPWVRCLLFCLCVCFARGSLLAHGLLALQANQCKAHLPQHRLCLIESSWARETKVQRENKQHHLSLKKLLPPAFDAFYIPTFLKRCKLCRRRRRAEP